MQSLLLCSVAGAAAFMPATLPARTSGRPVPAMFDDWEHGTAGTGTNWDRPFGAHAPFVLISHVQVKREHASEYLAAAERVNRGTEADEPGLLHQTLDVDRDDPESLLCCWTEVFSHDAAFMAHLHREPVRDFLRQMTQYVDWVSLECYGTVEGDVKATLKATGFPVKWVARPTCDIHFRYTFPRTSQRRPPYTPDFCRTGTLRRRWASRASALRTARPSRVRSYSTVTRV